MKRLDQLELPYLAIDDPEFAKNPFPHFAEARKQHPWLATCPFGTIVHGHVPIRELLIQDAVMEPMFDDVIEMLDANGTEWGRFQHTQLLNLTGIDHKRIRDIVAHMFTPKAANNSRILMRETMLRVLEEWKAKGQFNFEEFVSYFPITVMCALIGASPDVVPSLRSSMEALGLAFGMNKDFMPKVQEGHLVMDEFVHKLVAERRAQQVPNEKPDLLDTLIAVVGDDEKGLTERELHDLLIFLFVAGYDTSKNVLTFIMKVMLDYPEEYARCAEDKAFCTKVVEEVLRLHSPATITRRVGADVEYRDVLIPKGTLLYFTVNVSGRDAAIFDKPDEFIPEREVPVRHTAFGRGMHLCLGQYIARAQIEEGLHLIAQHIKNPRLAGPVDSRPFPGVWGLKGLPIEFDIAS